MHEVINILLPLCHQQKGEVATLMCLLYGFKPLHEKHNIKFLSSCNFEDRKFSK